MILLAALLCNYGRGFCLIDVGTEGSEERWFSIGYAANGSILSVVYLWSDAHPAVTKIRLISARNATQTEIRYHQEGL